VNLYNNTQFHRLKNKTKNIYYLFILITKKLVIRIKPFFIVYLLLANNSFDSAIASFNEASASSVN
jgi:hypothetical protein